VTAVTNKTYWLKTYKFHK